MKLDDFLSEEMSSSVSRKMMLDSISQAIRTGKSRDEFVFNRYLVELFYEEKRGCVR